MYYFIWKVRPFYIRAGCFGARVRHVDHVMLLALECSMRVLLMLTLIGDNSDGQLEGSFLMHRPWMLAICVYYAAMKRAALGDFDALSVCHRDLPSLRWKILH